MTLPTDNYGKICQTTLIKGGLDIKLLLLNWHKINRAQQKTTNPKYHSGDKNRKYIIIQPWKCSSIPKKTSETFGQKVWRSLMHRVIVPKAQTNIKYRNQRLLILLAAQPGQFVGDHNIQLCSTLNNLLSLLGWYVVSYLSTISPTIKR